MPPRLMPPLVLALLLTVPPAAAQSTLGEILDAGAQKLSADEFKEAVVQRPVTGSTAAGGTIEVMYLGNGTIVGSGTATQQTPLPIPVSGQWAVDASQRICTTMQLGANMAGAAQAQRAGVSLPTRCQFWFKQGESYFLADSDSDRHARVVRRTLVALASARPAIEASTLPAAMKGYSDWHGAIPGYTTVQIHPWSLAIAKTNPDGTFEGVITFVGPGCAARELPIANGVVQGGEARFTAPMGARCPRAFRLRRGSEHLLEGEAELNLLGSKPLRVWLDPSP